jgi:hypothetical protein
MRKLKYILFIALFSSLALWSKAQNNTISPYSKLGLGDFQSMGFARSAAMGGSGIALRSKVNLNSLNPASISALDSTVTIFDAAVHYDYTHLKTSLQSGAKNNANLSYLAIGLGINKKWGMSFGLMPYTNVGYTFETSSEINGSGDEYYTKYEGSGGLSKFFFTNGYKITNDISLGVNVSFLFGPKNETEYYGLSNAGYYEVTQTLSTRYSGFIFDLGYQQKIQLNPKNELTLGITTNAPSKLRYNSTLYVSQLYSESGSEDTLRYDESITRTVDFPVNFGGGLAYNYNGILILTADYSRQNWSNFTIQDSYADLIDNHKFTFGMEFTPKRLAHRTSISYRLGTNYQSGYFNVDGINISSMAYTAGVSFNVKSIRFNLYSVYSSRGTINNQLIKEDFVRIGLNVSMFENWLQRRQYR